MHRHPILVYKTKHTMQLHISLSSYRYKGTIAVNNATFEGRRLRVFPVVGITARLVSLFRLDSLVSRSRTTRR